MILRKLKKYNTTLLIMLMISLLIPMFSYAKSYKREPEFPKRPAPENEKGEGHAEAVIYSNQKGLQVKTPLNPTPSNIDEKEKALYDNYVIDINTIPKRIEYFSPIYTYAMNTAQSSILGQLGAAGISAESSDSIRGTIIDYRDNKKEINRGIPQAEKAYEKRVKEVIESGGNPSTDGQVIKLYADLMTLKKTSETLKGAVSSYRGVQNTFNMRLNMVRRAGTIAGLDSTKDALAQGIILAYLSYKKLEGYEEVLKQQVDLNRRTFDLYVQQASIGLATNLDVNTAKLNLDSAIDSYNNVKATKDDVEKQILTNLGYNINDKNKIIYVEPEIDVEKLLEIDVSKDYERTYHSNKTYQSIYNSAQSSRNRNDDYNKEIYDNYKNEYKQKIMNNLDMIYAKLAYAYKTYEGSMKLQEAYDLDVKALETKKKQNLVSDVEALGLELQNLSTKLTIISAKYDLLTAYWTYYYATLGIGTL